jgi:hypothetical protein
MTINYGFEIDPIYTNDAEYRKCIRDLFRMKNVDVEGDIDDISRDEMDYDEDSINPIMAQLFELTKNNVHFQELYDLAAAKLMSIDRETGQVVLFSFQYMWLYHKCLAAFYHNDPAFQSLILELKSQVEIR